jgi:hypothetical protein
MGFMDRIKSNVRVQRLSFMTSAPAIVAFCQGLDPSERAEAIRGIESMFKWQPVAQIAQGLFSSYSAPHGVSADAKDLVMGGYVSAGVELMAMQNQAQAPPPQFGMLPMQQVALSYAWTVLKALEQQSSQPLPFAAPAASARAHAPTATAPQPSRRFCTRCGAAASGSARFCGACGGAL